MVFGKKYICYQLQQQFLFLSICLLVSLSHCLLVCLFLDYPFPVCLLSIIFFNRWKAKFSKNCETLPDSSGQQLFFFSSEQTLPLKKVQSCFFGGEFCRLPDPPSHTIACENVQQKCVLEHMLRSFFGSLRVDSNSH